MTDLKKHLRNYFSHIFRKKMAAFFLVLFMIFLAKGINLILPWMIGKIVDELTVHQMATSNLNVLLMGFVAAWIFSFFVGIAQNYVLSNFVQSVNYDTAKEWLKTIFRKDFSFFSQLSVGQLVKSTERGLIAHEKALHFVCYSSLPMVVELLISGILIFSIAGFKLSLWILIPLIAQNYTSRKVIQLRRREIENVNEAEDGLSAELTELISNGKSIKLENRVDFVSRKIDGFLKQYSDAALRLTVSGSVLTYCNPSVGYLIVSLIIYVGAGSLGTVALSVGTIVSLMTYGSRMAGVSGDFLESMRQFQQFKLDVSGFLKTLNEPEFDRQRSPELAAIAAGSNRELAKLSLSPFQVNKGKTTLNVINSIEINPGEKVAILGPSGGGKTTLLETLAGMTDEARQVTKINGQPLSCFSSEEHLRIIRYNPQSPSLLSGSIAEGVFFQKDLSISENEILRKMNLSEFAENSKRQISERATNLSGGEARRLALARALVRPGPITLLDEPTSAVNNSLSGQIWDEIFAATENKTLIAVTHDAKEIHRFDRVILVVGGQIVADLKPEDAEKHSAFAMIAKTAEA